MLLLILTINITSNIASDWSQVRVLPLGRHRPIEMLNVEKVRIISSACICNGRQGLLLFEAPWRDLTTKEGAV
jgi:hypothetical protein